MALETSLKQGSYNMKVDKVNKTFTINFNGFFDEEIVKEFFGSYLENTKTMNVGETTLILDGTELKTSTQGILNSLEEAFKLYTAFKKIYLINPKLAVAKIQLARVARAANVDKVFEFVNSASEIA